MAEPTVSIKLPEGEDVEVVIIQLADGRKVARTRQELEEAQTKTQGGGG